MTRSKFSNPHGLMNLKNVSTVDDMCKLCKRAWSNKTFQKICATKSYKCNIKDLFNKDKVLEWDNTNILLKEEGFTGLKTGWTYAANACLAATYTNKNNNKTLLAVVFNSPTKASRFDDCRNLLLWANNKLYNENKTENENASIFTDKSKINSKPKLAIPLKLSTLL